MAPKRKADEAFEGPPLPEVEFKDSADRFRFVLAIFRYCNEMGMTMSLKGVSRSLGIPMATVHGYKTKALEKGAEADAEDGQEESSAAGKAGSKKAKTGHDSADDAPAAAE